jgi:hypothetical protein
VPFETDLATTRVAGVSRRRLGVCEELTRLARSRTDRGISFVLHQAGLGPAARVDYLKLSAGCSRVLGWARSQSSQSYADHRAASRVQTPLTMALTQQVHDGRRSVDFTLV